VNVTVEPRKCIAAGMCVAHAPEVFDQDDDNGIVVLLAKHPTSDQADNVRNAAELCPAQVISVSE
jgi:ferredoxin